VALVVLPWRTVGSADALPPWVSALGVLLALAGLAFGLAGAVALSTALTPTPVPKEGEVLRTNGAYRIVRHPLYTSVLTAAVGFTLAVGSWWQVGVCAALAVFFAYKSRWEDSMLAERFGDEWRAYARRTPGIIPLARRR
jgi:protein-S-isoprenylcysteine O-methyltransferase Ste14